MRSNTDKQHARRGARGRRRVPRPVGRRRAEAGDGQDDGARSRSSSPWPIPIPEIWPPDAKAARPDAIIATGRSDFPNQVNNVLGFPFIFRGALDVRATAINDAMKIAAAEALAELAREPVPEEVAAAYGGRAHSFGRDYIIPAPFDPRLMEVVAVRRRRSGGAERRRAEADRRHGRLSRRSCARGSTRPSSVMSLAYENARAEPEAGAVRRGRGAERASRRDRVQGGGLRHPGAGRARGRLRAAARSSGVDNPQRIRSAQQPQLAAGRARRRLYLRQAPAPRHAAPRGRADGQSGPQLFRRGDARARRSRRDDHRHDAAVQPVAAAGADW